MLIINYQILFLKNLKSHTINIDKFKLKIENIINKIYFNND
jgi:hypothetical protein